MDYIDLRDVIENKKEDKETYQQWEKAIEETGYNLAELAENEPTMIPESEWKDYAWDMANDVFEIDLDKGNISIYFDLDKWADDLKMDYSEVEVDGTTYFYRQY